MSKITKEIHSLESFFLRLCKGAFDESEDERKDNQAGRANERERED